jgi:hypothetical protein
MSQDVCLIYRFTVILENPTAHRLIITKRVKVVAFVIWQIVALGIAYLTYTTLVPAEVSLCLGLNIRSFC